MVNDFLPMRDEEIDRYVREFNAGTVIGVMARQLQSLRPKPETVISAEMVNAAMRAFYHDAPEVLTPMHQGAREDLERWSRDMHAALIAAMKEA